MNKASQERTGGRDEALRNGRRLLASDPASAAEQAHMMLLVDREDGDALRLMGAALRALGRTEDAERAELDAIRASSRNPTLVEAANAIAGGNPAHAERLLRPYLARVPDDAAASHMLGRIAADVGAIGEAEHWLTRALALAPGYAEARLSLARLLADRGRLADALAELELQLARQSADARVLALKALLLGRLGDYQAALDLHERLIELTPDRPKAWLTYGHALRTVGRRDEAISAYRRALAIDPSFGEAWWGIANLKTEQFDMTDVAAVRSALAQAKAADDLVHLHFALGKAADDAHDPAEAFRHYSEANRLRRAELPYNSTETTKIVDKSIAVFTAEFFSRASEGRNQAADPIFIVGMPRAGSTLVEQILASHSRIEGTSELPYIQLLTGDPEAIVRLSDTERSELGGEYLRLASRHRKSKRPYFIDKLPNNWLNVGFIHHVLPNAKIIDVRRHPLGSGLGMFKQHFGQGQAFAYDLTDIGLYYRDYVRLLAHYDRVLPGRVHRLFYERLVDDPEAEIRRLLDYLGLEFEPGCTSFYRNDRPVRTPSSEQVRQPINRSGVESWQAYEPWLGALKHALGPVLGSYPEVPD